MASRSLGTLTLDLVAKTGGFVAGMSKAERESEKWKRKVKRNIDESARALRNLSIIASGALVASFGAVVRASGQQEQAIKQVEQRLLSTGNAAGKTSEGLQQMAASLQNVTTFGDEAILEMQSMLLTFTNIRGEIFDQTVPAILDLSVAMDQDLKSSVLQLGKALNDPIKNLSALSRAGIQFSKEQETLIKSLAETGRLAEAQTIIIEELNKQFGGSAAAAADTFAGKIDQIKNAFGDLLENPGGLKANRAVLDDLVSFLQDPETIQAANRLTGALISGFRTVAESIRTTIGLAQFLGEEFAAITGGAAADDIVRLEEQLALAKSALENPTERLRFFGPGGLVEYWDEGELKAEIARLEEAIGAERDRLASQYKRKPIIETIAPPEAANDAAGAISKVSDELQNVQAIAARRERPAVIDELIEAQKEYQALVKELRTDEERLTDQLRERLAIIDRVSGNSTAGETRSRAIADAFGGGPEFAGLAPEVGGAASELLKIDDARESLKEWYNEQLDLLRGFREEKLITAEEYNELEAEIAQEHADRLVEIEQARQLATLTATEELFGNLAGLAKQFAGEQSAAYQVLFAIEKAAAIARSIIAIQTAIAQAAASGPFPANLAAMASVAAATAGLISTITSTTIQGQAHDGIERIPKTGTWLLQEGERVTTERTSAKLDATLEDIRKNRQVSSAPKIRIVNTFDADEVVGGYLGSDAAERAVMNIVSRNQRTIRSLAS